MLNICSFVLCFEMGLKDQGPVLLRTYVKRNPKSKFSCPPDIFIFYIILSYSLSLELS